MNQNNVHWLINVAGLGANISDTDHDYYTNMVDTGIKELKFTDTGGYALAKSCTYKYSLLLKE